MGRRRFSPGFAGGPGDRRLRPPRPPNHHPHHPPPGCRCSPRPFWGRTRPASSTRAPVMVRSSHAKAAGGGGWPLVPGRGDARAAAPAGPGAETEGGVGGWMGVGGKRALPWHLCHIWLHPSFPLMPRETFAGKASERKVSRRLFQARIALAWHRRGWVCFGVSRYLP